MCRVPGTCKNATVPGWFDLRPRVPLRWRYGLAPRTGPPRGMPCAENSSGKNIELSFFGRQRDAAQALQASSPRGRVRPAVLEVKRSAWTPQTCESPWVLPRPRRYTKPTTTASLTLAITRQSDHSDGTHPRCLPPLMRARHRSARRPWRVVVASRCWNHDLKLAVLSNG